MHGDGILQLRTDPSYFDFTEWPFNGNPQLVWEHEGVQCAYVLNGLPALEQKDLDKLPEYLRGYVQRQWYCGYVKIPKGHPWWQIPSYDEIPADASGGLTYGPLCHLYNPRTFDCIDDEALADRLRLSPLSRDRIVYIEETGGWIGFDCNHAFDQGMWMAEMVVEEVERLAAQVAAAL